jgi:hypothetical protein
MHSNNRNNRDESNTNSVDSHVQKLFKEKDIDNENLDHHINKIPNATLRDKVRDDFVHRSHKIFKKAHKFAKLIREKYGHSQLPYHIILEKARKFKDRYELSEAEFSAFQRIYELDLQGRLDNTNTLNYSTNLSKVLGSPLHLNTLPQESPSLSDNDYKKLQEIYKLFQANKTLHSQILLQTSTYTDCSVEALMSKYDSSEGHLRTDHIHPVLVALFLPKINTIDSHFLMSNLSEILFNRLKVSKKK